MLYKKVAQVFPKVAQKVASPVWLKKQRFSQLPKKSPNIWATFVIKFIAKKIKKLPNLVTLITRDTDKMYSDALKRNSFKHWTKRRV